MGIISVWGGLIIEGLIEVFKTRSAGFVILRQKGIEEFVIYPEESDYLVSENLFWKIFKENLSFFYLLF